MREFVKRFSSGWVGWVLGAITILSVLSIALTDIPWGFTVVAVLLIALRKSYQLFTEQQKEIMQQKDDLWSARNGTSLFMRIEKMPVVPMRKTDIELHGVYVVNRRQGHPANVSFTLIADGIRLRANLYGDPVSAGSVFIPSPKHIEAGASHEGYLSFGGGGHDLTRLVVEGVRLEVRDEQTGFTHEIDLPTGSDGVELIQRREVADGVGNV